MRLKFKYLPNVHQKWKFLWLPRTREVLGGCEILWLTWVLIEYTWTYCYDGPYWEKQIVKVRGEE